jgi:hypothetical protein
MKPVRYEALATARQLWIALDSAKLRGMTQAERDTTIGRLAQLLLEAAAAAEVADERE